MLDPATNRLDNPFRYEQWAQAQVPHPTLLLGFFSHAKLRINSLDKCATHEAFPVTVLLIVT